MRNIGAIIQCRMSSQRLPGKMLKQIKGKPLLQYVIEKVEHCSSINDFVIATSTEKSDDRIAAFCNELNLFCYRGSLHDVAHRFKEVCELKNWDAFVRINGDSPLIDPLLIEEGIHIYLKGNYDLVTNIFPRSYPPGQSIEVVNSQTFQTAYEKMALDDEFEHVTKFFYHNPELYHIYNFTSVHDYSNIHMAVDTDADFRRINTLISEMKKPHWEYHITDLITLIRDISWKIGDAEP